MFLYTRISELHAIGCGDICKNMEMTRAERIAEQLEGLIFDGTLNDGERLDEVQLAEQFGVSRTPVREALQRLILSGLVQQIPRRGVFVRQPSPVELLEMFEVMAELEAASARFAASRMTDAALVALHAANERCNAAMLTQDADVYYRENEKFHKIIYGQSGNGYLEQECLSLHRRLQPFRRIQLRFRGRLKQSMSEHEAVLSALEEGDGARAAEVMRDHVAVQGEKFQRLIASLKPAAE